MEIERANEKGVCCALIEGPRRADCGFYALWLLAVAKAERLWTETLAEHDFKAHVEELCALCVPNFELAACEILVSLEQETGTAIVRMRTEEEVEFGMMILLGFFRLTGRRYQMTIPRRLTRIKVKKAALALLGTGDAEDCATSKNSSR